MKYTIYCILFLLAFHTTGNAQEDGFKTIFHNRGDQPVRLSGFGGPMMYFTSIDGNFAHFLGGGGGLMVNNFFFGGYGVGLTSPIPYPNASINNQNNLNFGHGGFWMGFIISPGRPVHLSISSLAGWGSINESDSRLTDINFSEQPVFVIAPIVEIELNFSRFFKVGAGTTINLVTGPGIERTEYSFRDFANPSVFLSFKFGWFNS